MLTHLLAFAAGAVLVWFLRPKPAAAEKPASAPPFPVKAAPDAGGDPMQATDLDLDAAIIEFISDNRVFHINDVCRAIEHPKGSRFVRAHFHRLMEQGKIRYRNMTYTI